LGQTTNTSGDSAIASGLAIGSSNGPSSSGPGLPVWLGLRLETLASPSNATSIQLLEGDSPPLAQIDDVVDALDDDLLASLGE
jgi:hypothetical protein